MSGDTSDRIEAAKDAIAKLGLAFETSDMGEKKVHLQAAADALEPHIEVVNNEGEVENQDPEFATHDEILMLVKNIDDKTRRPSNDKLNRDIQILRKDLEEALSITREGGRRTRKLRRRGKKTVRRPKRSQRKTRSRK